MQFRPLKSTRTYKPRFMLCLCQTAFKNRIQEVGKYFVQQGHEAGNHTFISRLSKNLTGRDWVPVHNNLDNKACAWRWSDESHCGKYLITAMRWRNSIPYPTLVWNQMAKDGKLC